MNPEAGRGDPAGSTIVANASGRSNVTFDQKARAESRGPRPWNTDRIAVNRRWRGVCLFGPFRQAGDVSVVAPDIDRPGRHRDHPRRSGDLDRVMLTPSSPTQGAAGALAPVALSRSWPRRTGSCPRRRSGRSRGRGSTECGSTLLKQQRVSGLEGEHLVAYRDLETAFEHVHELVPFVARRAHPCGRRAALMSRGVTARPLSGARTRISMPRHRAPRPPRRHAGRAGSQGATRDRRGDEIVHVNP